MLLTVLEEAVQVWDAGHGESVHSLLRQAISLAQDMGYFSLTHSCGTVWVTIKQGAKGGLPPQAPATSNILLSYCGLRPLL
jgi:hypothetical protein